jgi:hypothetical protein
MSREQVLGAAILGVRARFEAPAIDTGQICHQFDWHRVWSVVDSETRI